jgi:glycosyltransferase involved in cell wall biosynthesis
MTAVQGHIVFLTWRDTLHPDGGGSEVYVERMASWLVDHGYDITIVCAAHPNAPHDELRAGVRFRRRGGRLTVYPRGLAYLLTRAGRRADVVIDVQNGIPFFSPLVRRRAIIVLMHHVHREQWHIIYPGVQGRFGWWLESWVAPRVNRGRPYVTVSDASAADLAGLGVKPDRIHLIPNGIDLPTQPSAAPRHASPKLCVLSRLVPHKQIEHALTVVARLRERIPELHLDIVGDGWWRPNLERYTAELGIERFVTFHGHVDEAGRDAILAGAWVLLTPSAKEGWGIAIMEAATHGVPALAYTSAGGVRESILDGYTGLLVDDLDGLTQATERLLRDSQLRGRMSAAARARAADFNWPSSAEKLRELLDRVQRLP